MKIARVSHYKRTEGAPLSPNSPHRRVVIAVKPETLVAIRDKAEARNVSFANESRRLIESGLLARRFRCCPFCGGVEIQFTKDRSSAKCKCGPIMPGEWFA